MSSTVFGVAYDAADAAVAGTLLGRRARPHGGPRRRQRARGGRGSRRRVVRATSRVPPGARGQDGEEPFPGYLDHWDPAVTDGLAREREVMLCNNAGIASAAGEVPKTFAGMARNAEAFIDALGLPG
jgi:hypothetical protein